MKAPRVDAAFAVLLLVAGHLALAGRLGWGWFDVLLLDLWLVPFAAWNVHHRRDQNRDPEQPQGPRDGVAHRVRGAVAPVSRAHDTARHVERDAAQHHEFECARAPGGIEDLSHSPSMPRVTALTNRGGAA